VSIGNRPIPPGPKRGEIYKLDFRDIGGNVLSGPHWAVVVQSSMMSRSSTTLAVPITSNAASAALKPEYLVEVSAHDVGLSWGGFIHADQVFTFPARELGERAGVLAGSKLDELDRALAFVLDLP
jgi:mRNA-degrading endonuclease toxin of MazEF toxin-antitoxin module